MSSYRICQLIKRVLSLLYGLLIHVISLIILFQLHLIVYRWRSRLGCCKDDKKYKNYPIVAFNKITNTKMKISSDKAIINCEFRTAPFSGNTRSKSSFGDRKSVEITNVLRQAFEAAILTNLYPGSQIDIFFLALYSDGGISSICINAGTLAVINAGIPMKDYLCACSSGFVNETPLTDINHVEGFTGNTEFTLAMLIKSGAIVSEELNARIHRDHMNKLKQSAIQGCKDIYEILDAAVRKHAALNQSC